jgi:hypothetical protein
MIIAPITDAVESVTTPYVAMTVASASMTMKFTTCLFFLSPSKNSLLSKPGRYSGSNRFLRIFMRKSVIMTTAGIKYYNVKIVVPSLQKNFVSLSCYFVRKGINGNEVASR